jgi:hypothetical protein
MNEYMEYIADRLSVSLGYSKIYKTKNPFTFMDTIGMMQKTNFHEQRPTEYQSAHINFESKNIKGEIHFDEWKDFGYNRTLALKYAYKKSDYLRNYNEFKKKDKIS